MRDQSQEQTIYTPESALEAFQKQVPGAHVEIEPTSLNGMTCFVIAKDAGHLMPQAIAMQLSNLARSGRISISFDGQRGLGDPFNVSALRKSPDIRVTVDNDRLGELFASPSENMGFVGANRAQIAGNVGFRAM